MSETSIPPWKRRFNTLTWRHPIAVGLAMGLLCWVLIGIRLDQWNRLTAVQGVFAAAIFTCWFVVRRRRHDSPEALAQALETRVRSTIPTGRLGGVLAILFAMTCLVIIWLAMQ